MKITIHYDFIQKDLMGALEHYEVPDNTTLRKFLEEVDEGIREKGASEGVGTKDKTILCGDNLNSCVVAINNTPPKTLDEPLKDGDIITLMYGFCGG